MSHQQEIVGGYILSARPVWSPSRMIDNVHGRRRWRLQCRMMNLQGRTSLRRTATVAVIEAFRCGSALTKINLVGSGSSLDRRREEKSRAWTLLAAGGPIRRPWRLVCPAMSLTHTHRAPADTLCIVHAVIIECLVNSFCTLLLITCCGAIVRHTVFILSTCLK